MTNKVKLHVGYVGITRNGKRMEIDNKDYDPEYPFKSGHYTYCSNGDYWSTITRISNLDIMGPWVEKVKEEEKTANYNDGSWHRWEGWERPVHRKTQVAVILTNNNQPIKDRAEAFSWNHNMDPILSFRVTKEYVEPPKVPRDFWQFYDHQIGKWIVNDKKPECIRVGSELIHVREVMDE
jgi:hypothetical protein